MNRICSEKSVLEVPGLRPLYYDSGEDQNPTIFFSDSSPLSDGTKYDINKKKSNLRSQTLARTCFLWYLCTGMLCNS